VPCEEIDRVARHVITEAGYGAQFIHRTGHGTGPLARMITPVGRARRGRSRRPGRRHATAITHTNTWEASRHSTFGTMNRTTGRERQTPTDVGTSSVI
jgi:hypothetical protein